MLPQWGIEPMTTQSLGHLIHYTTATSTTSRVYRARYKYEDRGFVPGPCVYLSLNDYASIFPLSHSFNPFMPSV
ncbi:hypothetical protein DPMN_145695 [Dreissena polymorpha]|uniref:Uncharacterized protein n=1 Tax=Dreissena polymorpha TaxID=45954 RepID=A0A9D4F4J9_DREPO|nr:hypothetical protein DPMN_145695 [Dreissena polymorpha]